jgi:hypothetical protein
VLTPLLPSSEESKGVIEFAATTSGVGGGPPAPPLGLIQSSIGAKQTPHGLKTIFYWISKHHFIFEMDHCEDES